MELYGFWNIFGTKGWFDNKMVKKKYEKLKNKLTHMVKTLVIFYMNKFYLIIVKEIFFSKFNKR